MSIGVPIKVLYEAEGHIVTCETKTGQTYRGKLIQAEDNMNMLLTSVTATSKNGKVTQLESVYIRGTKICFIILPNMVNNAPIFKLVPKKPTAGRGKSARGQAALRGQGRGRGRGHQGGWQEASGSSKH